MAGSDANRERLAALEAEIARLKSEVEKAEELKGEQEQMRQAMLYMMEDLNDSATAIEQAKDEWENTFDAVSEPIFLHDHEFRIIRANRAYADQAGMDFDELNGRPYWQAFPKSDGPLPGCAEALESANHGASLEKAKEEFVTPDGRVFISHSYAILDKENKNGRAVHFMQEITESKRAAEVLRESRAKLRAALDGTISAVTKMAEARDPYTSGHQRRVAELAAAIAKELGWTKDDIEGIRLGAMIHDLGKIHLPAEILSKPSRLNEIEFSLIKSHPEVGYGILKDIQFPWPVAEIAYQHHERLDGSGYPQGLKGDEICPQARIVAVADIVEAMASHRPYRPGLGIDVALAEVESQRGKTLDVEAVDACLRLFRENRFSFEA